MKTLRSHIRRFAVTWFIIVSLIILAVFTYLAVVIKYNESERMRVLLMDEMMKRLEDFVGNKMEIVDFALKSFESHGELPMRLLKSRSWFVLTESDRIVLTDHPRLDVGGVFLPKLSGSGEKRFGTVHILGRDYFVVAAKQNEKTLYLALDFSKLGELLPRELGDVYIISPEGKIISGGGSCDGLSVACLGIDMKVIERATQGEISRRYKDYLSRREPHGFYILSVYDKLAMFVDILMEISPYALLLTVGLFFYVFILLKVIMRIIVNPIENMVKDIVEGNVPIETDYEEFDRISGALEEFIIRLKSIYQGLRFTATLEFDVDLDDPDVELKAMKKFELSLPMIFRKYRAIAYYGVSDSSLEILDHGGRFDEMRQLLVDLGGDTISLKKIDPLLEENPLTAFWLWFTNNRGVLLMVPLYVDRMLKYVVMIYLSEVISRTESEAGEILVLEYNLILDQINLMRKLNTMATTDFLTGLKNRMYFMSRLEEECERAKRYGVGSKSFGVSMVDLDGLKRVNDTLGHEAGDEYIKTFAEFLKGFIRKSDIAGRLGGDEFGILWMNVDEKDLKIAESRLIEGLKELTTPEYGIKVSASIGSALYGKDGNTPDELLNIADMRMYRMKERKGVMRK